MIEHAIKLATELDLAQLLGNAKCLGKRDGVAPVTGSGQKVPSGASVMPWLVGRKRADVEILQHLIVTAGIRTFRIPHQIGTVKTDTSQGVILAAEDIDGRAARVADLA